MANGGVGMDATTSPGTKFSVEASDPHHMLRASNFPAADFVLA